MESTSSIEIFENSTRSGGLIYDLWTTTVEDLAEGGNRFVRPLDLRTTFRTASERIQVWGEDFDFEMSKADQVLSDSPKLCGAVRATFAVLIRMLCK